MRHLKNIANYVLTFLFACYAGIIFGLRDSEEIVRKIGEDSQSAMMQAVIELGKESSSQLPLSDERSL